MTLVIIVVVILVVFIAVAMIIIVVEVIIEVVVAVVGVAVTEVATKVPEITAQTQSRIAAKRIAFLMIPPLRDIVVGKLLASLEEVTMVMMEAVQDQLTGQQTISRT